MPAPGPPYNIFLVLLPPPFPPVPPEEVKLLPMLMVVPDVVLNLPLAEIWVENKFAIAPNAPPPPPAAT